MSNLQIKDIDERLYRELKRRAADENRSVSQQVLYWIRNNLAKKTTPQDTQTAAQTLLDLAGSWEDARPAEQIVRDIQQQRHSSRKLAEGL